MFSAITFKPVEIHERTIPQNKPLNLLNLKDFMLFVDEMAESGRKKDVYYSYKSYFRLKTRFRFQPWF